MIYPKFLQPGSQILVISPSDGNSEPLAESRITMAANKFEKRGYSVLLGKDIFHSEKSRSADALKRVEEIHNGISDSNIQLLIASAGGEYAMEILPYLDFSIVRKNPTWIQGFSDVTILTYTVTTVCDIATLYASNFKDFSMEKLHPTLINNLEILNGRIVEQSPEKMYQDQYIEYVDGNEGYRLTRPVKWKGNPCHMEGRLLGGCIDVLSNIVGTPYDHTKEFIEKYQEDGILWYLENCELSEAEFTRVLWKMRECGWFEHTNGILFGRSTVDETLWEQSPSEIVDEQLGKYHIPCLFDIDLGHKPPRMTFINGAYGIVDWNGKEGKFQQTLK